LKLLILSWHRNYFGIGSHKPDNELNFLKLTDFVQLIAAVRPRERTDQYKILSALYDLGGWKNQITVKEISDLMRLHLGTDVPVNVNASLRKYTGLVKVISKGPPLTWCLCDKGLDRLRLLSGLPLPTSVDEGGYLYDVGIVCALEEPELTSFISATGGDQSWAAIGNQRYTHIYRETTLKTATNKNLKLVATTSTSMGLTAATIATTQLVFQFRPKIVAMVGIAAGTRSSNKQFGDVLVADPSIDYNSGKVSRANGIREFLPDPYPIGLNARLRSVLHKYAAKPNVFAEIRSRWKGKLPGETNRLHVGPLGAADQVIDDAERIVEIQRNWRKLIGVEMETYGVYRACFESPEPKPRFVSFKSVCDFAAEKTDSWQSFAAFVAAEFTVQFFRDEWEALWTAT
jgi:nucleoside phosphorylase